MDFKKTNRSNIIDYSNNQFYLRIVDEDDIYNYNLPIATDLEIISLEVNEGPEGSKLTLRPYTEGKYAFCSDTNLLFDTLIDKTIYLEQRVSDRTSNKANTKILFFGKVSSIGYQYSSSENAMDIYVSSPWEQLLDSPVKMETKGLMVGQVLGFMDAGIKNETVYDRVSGTWITRTTTFDPSLFPKTKSGTQLGHIDGDLLNIFYLADGIELNGQPTGEAIAELVKVKNNIVLDVEYDNDGTFTVLGRNIGSKSHTLTMGRIGKEITNHDTIPDIIEINGSENYSNLYNRIIGYGQIEKLSTVEVLEKTWSTEEETTFLADNDLKDDLRYNHIGRLFKISSNIIPLNPKANQISNGLSDVSTYSDDFKILELNPETDDWQDSSSKPKIITSRNDGDINSLPNIITQKMNFSNGRFGYVFFDDVQFVEYISSSDRQSIEEDPDLEVNPTKVLKQLKIQCIKTLDNYSVNTGIKGDFNRERVKIHTSDYEKFTGGNIFTTKKDRTLQPSVVQSKDESPLLLEECQNILEQSSRPDVSITITLWYINTNFKMGDFISTIIDTHGEIIKDNLKWVIKNISFDFKTFRTQISCSRFVKTFGGAISI